MSDGLAELNPSRNLQALSAGSSDDLTALIRQIRIPIYIMAFVADSGKHTVYFRCSRKITVRQSQVEIGSSINSGQSKGESLA